MYLLKLESCPEPCNTSPRYPQIGCRWICEGWEQLLHWHTRCDQPFSCYSVSLSSTIYHKYNFMLARNYQSPLGGEEICKRPRWKCNIFPCTNKALQLHDAGRIKGENRRYTGSSSRWLWKLHSGDGHSVCLLLHLFSLDRLRIRFSIPLLCPIHV